MIAISKRRLGMAAGVVILATTSLVLIAEPALAIAGRVTVSSTTAFNSTSPKGGVVSCPPGTVPVGGGGEIKSSGPGITMVQDNPTATGWVYAAIEQTGGTAANWSVTMWVVCATAPAGYQLVVGSGTVSPSVPAVATCPGQKKVIGVGGTLDTAVGDNVRVITAIQPAAALTGVTVRAQRDPTAPPGMASNVVNAYALCINPQAGQNLATASTAANSLDKTLTVTCPFPTIPQGVGAVIGKGSGLVNITALLPATNPAGFAAVEHNGGYTGTWSMTGYAICLR